MRYTYHIHINGLVQGVGFRPFVCRLAESMHIAGWVSNTTDGVHIEVTADADTATVFYRRLIEESPVNATITQHSILQTDTKAFIGFSIRKSYTENAPNLLLTPDIAICDSCIREINDRGNKRFGYAFTTCLNCGPRYSITRFLPYDRENTTMSVLSMCTSCSSEYNDIQNIRHYSQTNSCKECAVDMHLYSPEKKELAGKEERMPDVLAAHFRQGKIIAVKGLGGYLLMCDATNEAAVLKLRDRKERPSKPFAVLYPNVESAGKDVCLRSFEKSALQEKSAPIVLCRIASVPDSGICTEAIAPGLDKIGVLLPCTPLLSLIAGKTDRPLIATSGNISGSPVICKDEDALAHLCGIADFVLTYDREIVAPQDDSVIQFTDSGKKIILRRSRGLAPNYFPNPLEKTDETILAAGSELKSAFALQDSQNIYISQYLGDQGTVESQGSYAETFYHLSGLLRMKPETILIDKHPGYFVSQFGREYGVQHPPSSVFEVQHHKAHFGAVLAENNLLQTKEAVLGFIWDGTGYGEDRQIWGGELFIFRDSDMERVAHLSYFPQLLGDKMSKEPRLSALSLLKDFPEKQYILQRHFSDAEWHYYQKAVQQENQLLTSSMGRFLDGLACLLGIRTLNSYEGEAAMQMETAARSCTENNLSYYSLPLVNGVLDWTIFMQEFIEDIEHNVPVPRLSRKVFYSLAKAVANASRHFQIDMLAFSGGVFQNALLTDLLTEELTPQNQLFFHQQLSPNDECIGFGQLACYQLYRQSKLLFSSGSVYTTSDINL